ncbi:hypothetical protein Ae263Ps1_3874c [Pseudonocardia sp. Ae263_Ps1]|nr:hypothetical protein Ae263Ps1_3874c [Pseudonocardia sp. Ae263_Ps1]
MREPGTAQAPGTVRTPGPGSRRPDVRLSGSGRPCSPAGVTEREQWWGPVSGPGHLLTRRRHVDLLRLAGCTCR